MLIVTWLSVIPETNTGSTGLLWGRGQGWGMVMTGRVLHGGLSLSGLHSSDRLGSTQGQHMPAPCSNQCREQGAQGL